MLRDKNEPVIITICDACFLGYIMSVCLDFHKKENFLNAEDLIQMKEIENKFFKCFEILN